MYYACATRSRIVVYTYVVRMHVHVLVVVVASRVDDAHDRVDGLHEGHVLMQTSDLRP
jgi:hypothetical protein